MIDTNAVIDRIEAEAQTLLECLRKDYKGAVRESVTEILKEVRSLRQASEPDHVAKLKNCLKGEEFVGVTKEEVAKITANFGAKVPEVEKDQSPEAVQWQNIQIAVRTIARFCFNGPGDKTQVSCGAAFTAVVNSVTAKDGAQFKLLPLPKASQSAESAKALCAEVSIEGQTLTDELIASAEKLAGAYGADERVGIRTVVNAFYQGAYCVQSFNAQTAARWGEVLKVVGVQSQRYFGEADQPFGLYGLVDPEAGTRKEGDDVVKAFICAIDKSRAERLKAA